MMHDKSITQFCDTLDPELVTVLGNRVHNAKDLVQLQLSPGRRPPIVEVTHGIYNVMSQSHQNQFYRVNVGEKSCTCPDAAAGRACKHRLAVYIYRSIMDESILENHARHQASLEQDRKAFKLWLSKNPTSVIDFGNWRSHPHQGTINYLDPISKEYLVIDVLASGTKIHPTTQDEYVEL
ncbi:MAG: SWIM zinc finger family protein, partial [Anaerolineales bacterium]